MPRIRLMDPTGLCWDISTRRPGTLEQWFDEVLPWTFITGRPDVDDFEVLWPRIDVRPMWAWGQAGRGADPDWSADSRAFGWHQFRAKNGTEGMAELERLRHDPEGGRAVLC